MSEYPPAASSQKVNSPSFAAALLRAQKIITKIESKRPLEDGQEPVPKKLAVIDSSGDYPLPSGSMGGPVGVSVGAGGRVPGAPNNSQQLTPEQTVNESMRVPDKMVGLIIGRSGEQISRIQAESGCKIQMAPDSGGQAERLCTLTGSRENVNRAREMVNGIVNQRGRDGRPQDGGPPQQRMGGTGSQNHEEIMIPGPKVGLIIGKGGETIKQLQEKSGAKMVVIQDGPNQEFEKPLRITGDPQKIEYAKQLVQNLIKEKEMQFSASRGGGPGIASGNNQMWGGGHEEFDQQGGPEGHERRDDDGRQPGPRGPPRNGGSDGPGGSYGSWSGGPQDDKVEVSFSVTNLKCGIIIGRGGEVIKQINAQSGAHCELDRRSQNNRANRVFFIRGTRDSVEAAKRIISEKVNLPLNFEESNGQNNCDGGGGSGSGSGDYSGGYGGQGAPAPGGAVASGGAGGAMWPYSPQWHPSQQQPEPQQHQPQSVPINPSTGQPDFSQQWIDYYNAVGLHQEAEKIQQKANKASSVGSQQSAQHSQAAVPSTNGSGGGGAGVANVASPGGGAGQPDYSAQWADYYRSIGKTKEAEQIELSMKQKQAAAVGASPAGPTNSAVGSYGGNASYQQQSYQQHYQGYGGYGGYPSHQAHPAPPDQQQ